MNLTETDKSVIDPGRFWQTLGERAVGMTLVTAKGGEGPAGFVGLSAAHVSADPATMLVSIGKEASTLEPVLTSGAFAINFLSASQESVAAPFMPKGERTKRFAEPEWTTLATGAPVLATALGVFDCTLTQTVDLDGTVIVIGEVAGLSAKGEGDPLIFFRGGYLR